MAWEFNGMSSYIVGNQNYCFTSSCNKINQKKLTVDVFFETMKMTMASMVLIGFDWFCGLGLEWTFDIHSILFVWVLFSNLALGESGCRLDEIV